MARPPVREKKLPHNPCGVIGRDFNCGKTRDQAGQFLMYPFSMRFSKPCSSRTAFATS
jgi:hypothetical protein